MSASGRGSRRLMMRDEQDQPPGEMVRTGLIGSGIGASRSPEMHEREARAQGFPLRYRLFDLDLEPSGAMALGGLLARLQDDGYAGVNITHPVKQAVIPLLDAVSPDAAAIGAVNTVSFAGGRCTGYNTDATGFAASLRRGLPEADLSRVVQLGAGGAGSATAHALMGMGAGLVLHDRDAARAASLADELAALYPGASVAAAGDLTEAMAAATGLVHATPTGMAAHPGLPLDRSLLRPALWVADIVYFPIETELLRAARAVGCATLDGGGMAVFQAAGAFEIFTNRPADVERMLRAFRGEHS
jgi:shikimate dehydrogenase